MRSTFLGQHQVIDILVVGLLRITTILVFCLVQVLHISIQLQGLFGAWVLFGVVLWANNLQVFSLNWTFERYEHELTSISTGGLIINSGSLVICYRCLPKKVALGELTSLCITRQSPLRAQILEHGTTSLVERIRHLDCSCLTQFRARTLFDIS